VLEALLEARALGTAGRAGLDVQRLDRGVESGDEVSVHYDPMLAKIIAHGPTREAALQRLLGALDDTRVHGVVTNLPFLKALLRAPDWQQIYAWRLQQEQELRRSGATGEGLMDEEEVRTFISYYERLTRYILDEMPARADLVLQLDADRDCISVASKGTL